MASISIIQCLIQLTLLLLGSGLVQALNKPPTLIRSIDLSTINENTPVNTYVFQLAAHDPEGTPVSFELDGTDLLRVDRRTGIVYVAKSIDREKTGEQIDFNVIIQDQVPVNAPLNANGQPDEANIVNIPVKVKILDENDNLPRWEYIDPNITIPEDTDPGTAIISELMATDADSVGSTLRANCDGCGSLFHLQNLVTPSISLIKFSLILTQHIDFRLRANQFNITLYVSDGAHNSSLRLFITIKDVQNKPPIFIGSKEISLPESTSVGTIVYHVRAIDGDALNDEQLISLNEKSVNLQFVNFGRKLAYFLDENPGNLFSLNQHNGELKILNQLDREASFLNHENNQTSLVVKVKAIEISDENGQLDDQEVSTARTDLVIRISDVNDEKPTFDKEQYSVTIKEDHQPGRILSPSLVISVKDRDLGLNSLFRVRLLETGAEYFQLQPTVIDGSGQITVRLKENYTLDYENVENRRFNLLLEAKELKTKEKFSTTAHLLITVGDVNDNPPVFLEHSYLANLIENAPPGSVIKSIQATDRDSPALTRLSYELRGDHSNLFDLDVKTGMLRVAHCQTPGLAPCLDFERRTHYNLTCTAYDGFGLNTTVPLRVQLLDANDNRPKFTRSVYEAEIEENADHFDSPVFVHATDLDISSQLTYTLVSDTTGSALPYDHQPTMPNNLEANYPENIDEPIAEDRISSDDLLASASRTLYESMIEVALPTGRPDMEMAEYGRPSLHNPFASLLEKQFSVDMKTGEIRVLRPVIYSEKPVVLTVKVSDGVHKATCKVKIITRDINNNEPLFDNRVYYANISEIAEPGQFVTRVVARDADVGLNAQIVYSMTPILDESESSASYGTWSNDFVISNRTGIITVNNALDYDRRNSYTFQLKAEDCGVPRRHTFTTVVISVGNENNKPPYFKPATQMTEVNEHTPVSTKIYKILAEDPDILVAQQQASRHHAHGGYRSAALLHHNEDSELLNFRIENIVALNKDGHQLEPGSPVWHEVNKFFGIDSNGYLIVTNPLHYELASLVTLNLSVVDTTAPYLQTGYGILVVKIIDYNDHPPTFAYPWTPLNPRIEFTTNEEQPVGTVVGRLQAHDQDTEIDYFKIDPPSRYFSIDNQTGVIRVERVLDYETIREEDLKFSVFVYDTGVPQLSSEATVHVKLINLNDNAPVFNQTDYHVSIPENLEFNSFVLRVNATDKDKGQFGKIKYSFVTAQLDENSEKTSAPTQDIHQYFAINEDTGVIRVTGDLDREAGLKELHFQVSAADNPDDSMSNAPTSNHPQRYPAPSKPSTGHRFADDLYSEESVSAEIQQPRSLAFANVHVKILDINDNPPVFQPLPANAFKIYDYSDISKEYNFYSTYFTSPRDEMRNLVLRLNATDADEGLNGLVKYRILSGNTNNVFELDEITGKLWASKTPLKINRDITSYRLEIEARDQNGKGKLSDKVQITATIHRVNKYKPQFLFPLGQNNGNGFTAHNTLGSINDNVVTVMENQPIGTRVAEIKAEDQDQGNNGIVRLSFRVSNTTVQETDRFAIDPKSGLITTKQVFDREQKSEYSVRLVACDYLAEPHQWETEQELIIKIGDQDDNLPEFKRPQNLNSLLSAKNPYLNSPKDDSSFEHNMLFNGPPAEDSSNSQSSDFTYTYLFSVTENLPKATVVGKVEAIDKDEKPENKRIFYHILDGNHQNMFSINHKTGLIQTNQPLDRESQSFYQLIIKASPDERPPAGHQLPVIGYRNLTQKFKMERERSYQADDRSLAIVGIEILDLNDNEPLFEKELYRVAVSHQAKLNDTLVFVRAKDPDNEANATLLYSIAHIEMFRKFIDDLENPVRPIPSPIAIDQNTGRLNVIQNMNQYPTQTRFVVHLEARERSSPFRIVRSIVHVYVYDPAKLIKITIRLRPSVVEQHRDNIEQLLSDNLENAHLRALITSIKYHLDVRRGRVIHEFTDCFVLVVDEQSLADISPEKMISKLDSNAAKLIFANDATNYQANGDEPAATREQQHYSIEQITLASTMMQTGSLQPLLYNFTSQLSSDTQTMVFFILCILILIGFVSMAVSCCCLKSWYYQKLVERAQLAQQKSLFNVGLANGMNGKYAPSFLATDQFGAVDPNELYTQQSVRSFPATYGCLNGGSLNGLNQEGSLRRPRSKNSTLRQQMPNENGGRTLVKDGAAWLDGGKYFEEQELSVQVATMDLTDDSVNYSVKQNGKNRQRLPANGALGQEVRKVNDYHELKNSSDGQSSDN